MISRFLCSLPAELAADGDHAHTDTVQVQRKRKARTELESDMKEKQERREFRVQVGASMIAVAIASNKDSLRKEEDKVLSLQLSLMESIGDEQKTTFYNRLIEHHSARIVEHEKDISDLRKQLADQGSNEGSA